MKLSESRVFFYAALLLIGVNAWHNTTRRIWNFSLRDSLTVGPDVIDLAQNTDPKIQIDKPYDGQFTYAVAHDPLLLSGKSIPYVNPVKYRYRRVLLPLLGHFLALGHPYYLPFTLFFINISAWVLSGWIAYKIMKDLGGNGVVAAIGVAVTSGIVFSTFRTLPEPLAMCLSLGGCRYFLIGKRRTAGVLFALSILARETAAIVPVGVALFSAITEKRISRETIVLILISLMPAVLWSAYLHLRLGPTAADYPLTHRISLPYVGFFQDVQLAQATLTTTTEKIRCYSILAATLSLSLIAYTFVWKYRSLWGTLAFMEAAFCSVMYSEIWSYYASAARVAAPLMIFSLLWYLDIARRSVEPKT